MTSTFPTKKVCVGCVLSPSGACEAPASALAFHREESRVDGACERLLTSVDKWGAPGDFQRKRIGDGVELKDQLLRGGGYSGYCGYNRRHTFTPRAEGALESL